jgi:hypothetical protein
VCTRIAYLLLAAFFVFVVVTIAAFVNLQWWQALLVSAATFALLVIGLKMLAKVLIRRTVGRFSEAAKGLFDSSSRTLRGATADVNSVRPAVPLQNDPDRRWYTIEATIFPDPAHTSTSDFWNLNDLRLVPADAAPPGPFQRPNPAEEFELIRPVLIENGEPVTSVDGQVFGPRRLRFEVGVPRDVHAVQFRYQFEQFGRIDLPMVLPGLPPANS